MLRTALQPALPNGRHKPHERHNPREASVPRLRPPQPSQVIKWVTGSIVAYSHSLERHKGGVVTWFKMVLETTAELAGAHARSACRSSPPAKHKHSYVKVDKRVLEGTQRANSCASGVLRAAESTRAGIS